MFFWDAIPRYFFFANLLLYVFNKSAYHFSLTCFKKNFGIENDSISSFFVCQTCFPGPVLSVGMFSSPIFFLNSLRNRDIKHAAEIADKLARAARHEN